MLSKCSNNWKLFIAVFALGFSTYSVAENDLSRGKVLADTCKGCHAVDSYTNVYPTYHVPRIAGQSAGYIEAALILYRDGERAHPTMAAQAGSFSDQDIKDISAYLGSLEPQLDVAAAAKGEAPQAAVVCSACHGAAGVSSIPTNPHLAGQHMDYLEEATEQYKRGDRKGPNAIAMQAQMNAISEEDLEAVLKFYALQDGLATMPMD